MNGKLTLIAAALSGCVAATPAGSIADGAGPPENLVEIARALPPLARSGHTIELPLQHVEPFAWRPIRGGIDVTSEHDDPEAVAMLRTMVARGELNGRFPALDATLRVNYERTRGMAAGVAFVLPPGTLAELEQLTLRIKGRPAQSLRLSLTDLNGCVFTFPRFRVDDEMAEIRLDPKELSFDPYQNDGPKPKSFELDRVIMLTVLDINGYMSLATPECTWTIESMTATLGAQAKSRRTSAPEPHLAAMDGGSRAERAFFDAFNKHPGERSDALRTLTKAWRRDPNDPRITLLLGLNHLWIASEGDQRDPRLIEHLQLACRHLRRAADLDPDNELIPGWLLPARIILARMEDREEACDALVADLQIAAEADPCFFSVPMGIACFDAPIDSERFRAGLAAMRVGLECAEDHPARANGPRWPYSAHGFLLALADLEWKAGEIDRARRSLEIALATPGFGRWPYRHLAQERLQRLNESGGAAPPPSFVLAPGNAASCLVCHARDEAHR